MTDVIYILTDVMHYDRRNALWIIANVMHLIRC